MVKKAIATFSDKKALRVFGMLVGVGLLFCMAALVAPSAFTTGAGDWSDPAYAYDASLLLDDRMQASFVLGVCCALFVVAETCLVWRYAAAVRHRRHRLAITLTALVMVAWFALTIAALEAATYTA